MYFFSCGFCQTFTQCLDEQGLVVVMAEFFFHGRIDGSGESSYRILDAGRKGTHKVTQAEKRVVGADAGLLTEQRK